MFAGRCWKMSEGVLLDTCTIFWVNDDKAMTPESLGLLERAARAGQVFASPISAWEIGMLTAKRRLALTMPVMSWFDQFLARSKVRLTELSPQILVASTELPEGGPRDPADQILTATARTLNLTLVTRDRRILTYAEQGHLRAAAC